jgi:2'-5' RNA ligase
MKSNRGKEELVGRIEKYREEEFGDFLVGRVILFKSDLKPLGPIYTLLKELKLGSQ